MAFILLKDKEMYVCDNGINSVPELMNAYDVPMIFDTYGAAKEFIVEKNEELMRTYMFSAEYTIVELTEDMEADILVRKLRRPVGLPWNPY